VCGAAGGVAPSAFRRVPSLIGGKNKGSPSRPSSTVASHDPRPSGRRAGAGKRAG